MFDSVASHNLMPKSVTERLNLDITRPYKDLFSFDSSQVKCLGLIKDLCVSLVQYPNKTILMDVVGADIPPKYGMLLSRSWGVKLQGSLQLDMSYATISVFGQPKRLYRESLMKYMVSNEDKPQNFPIYAVHSDIDSYILFNDNTGLTPLEDIFDSNDVPTKPKLQPLNTAIEECNIGTIEKPKIIKLSASLPPDQKPKYIDLFKEFQDVFAWSYEDLKSYDTSIIQHTIPLKPNQKPFKQKLRRINPMLLPSIEKEVQKMFKADIIAPIRFSEWISNLVPTRKKTGEIRLCVDLRNLNQVSLKDNYPLPKMDHILQRVVGESRISLLDGFSGFNQILVHPDDQDKTTFTTPWGTFKYVKMPFGLKNAGATFQRAMDIAFAK
eukprot:PITA_29729